MSRPTIVFDLDGTLIDTAPDLVRAVNHALGETGIAAIELPLLKTGISRGARHMIEHAVAQRGEIRSAAEIDRMQAMLLEFYDRNIAVESTVYPGVVDALKLFARKGYRLAVCTNKLEAPSRKLLKALALDRHFQAIVGRDTLPVSKPDPGHLIGTVILADGNLDRSIMVGDSEIDVATAKSAGIPVVGVTFGYTPIPIAELGPDAVIDHFRELPDAVERLLAALAEIS